MCTPKKSKGLGVKDLRPINLDLLAKWRWRLLTGLLVFGMALCMPVMEFLLFLLSVEVELQGISLFPPNGEKYLCSILRKTNL